MQDGRVTSLFPEINTLNTHDINVDVTGSLPNRYNTGYLIEVGFV